MNWISWNRHFRDCVPRGQQRRFVMKTLIALGLATAIAGIAAAPAEARQGCGTGFHRAMNGNVPSKPRYSGALDRRPLLSGPRLSVAQSLVPASAPPQRRLDLSL